MSTYEKRGQFRAATRLMSDDVPRLYPGWAVTELHGFDVGGKAEVRIVLTKDCELAHGGCKCGGECA